MFYDNYENIKEMRKRVLDSIQEKKYAEFINRLASNKKIDNKLNTG